MHRWGRLCLNLTSKLAFAFIHIIPSCLFTGTVKWASVCRDGRDPKVPSNASLPPHLGQGHNYSCLKIFFPSWSLKKNPGTRFRQSLASYSSGPITFKPASTSSVGSRCGWGWKAQGHFSNALVFGQWWCRRMYSMLLELCFESTRLWHLPFDWSVAHNLCAKKKKKIRKLHNWQNHSSSVGQSKILEFLLWLSENESNWYPWECCSIPGLAQWVRNLALLWLWNRPAAVAPIWPLA